MVGRSARSNCQTAFELFERQRRVKGYGDTFEPELRDYEAVTEITRTWKTVLTPPRSSGKRERRHCGTKAARRSPRFLEGLKRLLEELFGKCRALQVKE
jgi:hypothetical protein